MTRQTTTKSKSTTKTKKRKPHAVTQYALDVLSGRIVAGQLVVNACQRHLDDLETGAERGLRFNRKKASRALKFIEKLKHVKGEWASDRDPRIKLEAWQKFIVGSLFGWERWDEKRQKWLRRFKESHVEVARKNSKSTMMAGIGLYALIGLRRFGAEIYSIATKREQARLSWQVAAMMIKRDPYLKRILRIMKDNILYDESASFFRPLGSKSDTLDGLNVFVAIIDEIHAHRNGQLYGQMKYGAAAQIDALLLTITTSGTNQKSFGYERRRFAEKVVKGEIAADDLFVYIAAIDEDDDWIDPAVWIKANPNLGVSVDLDEMRAACRDAQAIPHERNEFIAKRCNRWTTNTARWMPMDKWDACTGTIDMEALKGRKCFAGFDVSAKDDLTSLVLVFPPEKPGEKTIIVPRVWTTSEYVKSRERKGDAHFVNWVSQGLIEVVEGGTIDNRVIREALRQYKRDYKIAEVGCDDWNAYELMRDLEEDGLTVLAIPQNMKHMSGPTKKLLYMAKDGELNHGGNEVLRWMVSNVVVQLDANANIRPTKEKSEDKIDGVVATICAISRSMLHKPKPKSVFDGR